MNPMIRKELQQRMRERRAWLLPSLYLVALGAAAALSYYMTAHETARYGGEPQGASIGVALFMTVAFVQLGLLLLLAPIFSAGSLTMEKEQRTMAGLLTSLLTPQQIWWGKYAASMLFLALLMICAVPVLGLAFALGGVGPVEVLLVTGVTLLVLAVVTAVGLNCSSFFRRSVHSTAVCYGVVILLAAVTAIVYGILLSYWETSLGGQEPWYLKAPLWLNPFYMMFAVFDRRPAIYPDWAISLKLFVALGLLAIAFALRNIERSGEQL